jgi:ABC-type transport system substrate-binding protein
VIKGPTTRLNSFQAGEIDVDMDPSIVQVQQVQNNPAIVFYHGSGFASSSILLGDGKNADFPFALVQVRQALSYALNRDSLVKNILEEYGIATNRISPRVPGLTIQTQKLPLTWRRLNSCWRMNIMPAGNRLNCIFVDQTGKRNE